MQGRSAFSSAEPRRLVAFFGEDADQRAEVGRRLAYPRDATGGRRARHRDPTTTRTEINFPSISAPRENPPAANRHG
jgi:hypothetical protein